MCRASDFDSSYREFQFLALLRWVFLQAQRRAHEPRASVCARVSMRLLGADTTHLAASSYFEGLQHSRHERTQDINVVTSGHDDNDAHPDRPHVLLKLHASIGRYQCVELSNRST
jgi:hypothetical protein